MKELSKKIIALTLILHFWGCSGAESSTSAQSISDTFSSNLTTRISGSVADGYISGAIVCLDKNNNAQCEEDEPTATSNQDGRYSFDINSSEVGLYPITVEVPEGAIDSDSGEITQSYIMQAPKEKTEFVSPTTTLVKMEMERDEELSADEAQEIIQEELGFLASDDIDLFKDFMIEKESNSAYETLHESAQVIARIIQATTQEIQTESNNSNIENSTISTPVLESIKPKLGAIKTAVENNTSIDTVVQNNKTSQADVQTIVTTIAPTTATTSTSYTLTKAPEVVDCSTLTNELGSVAVNALLSKGFDKCAMVFGFLVANSITSSTATSWEAYNNVYWTQLSANVLAEIMDNNQDGIADDTKVVDKMQSKNKGGWMPLLRQSLEAGGYDTLIDIFGEDTAMKESWFRGATTEKGVDTGVRGIIAQEAIHNWQQNGLAKGYPSLFGVPNTGCSDENQMSSKGCTFVDSILTRSTKEAITLDNVAQKQWYGQSPSGNVYNTSKGYNVGDCTAPNCSAIEYYYNLLVAYRAKGLWTNDVGKDPFDFPSTPSEVESKLNETDKGKALLAIMKNSQYHQLENGITFVYNPRQ